MKYLQLGINIPILPQFEKYILRNLERYSDVKSILLKEKIVNSRFGRNSDIISGNCLVFNHSGDNTQYFGYFGV